MTPPTRRETPKPVETNCDAILEALVSLETRLRTMGLGLQSEQTKAIALAVEGLMKEDQ